MCCELAGHGFTQLIPRDHEFLDSLVFELIRDFGVVDSECGDSVQLAIRIVITTRDGVAADLAVIGECLERGFWHRVDGMLCNQFGDVQSVR